jgi:hypothetical protein
MRYLALIALAFACTDDGSVDNSAFPTFQTCYNKFHNSESIASVQAIESCCIDHPIGGATMNTVCGGTTASCKAYVAMNLTDPNDPTLSTACTNYPFDSGR